MTTNPTPHSARTRYTHAQRRLLKEAHGIDQQIGMYREMLEVARRYGHEYEIERLTRSQREFEAEMDDVIERAVDIGLELEDFEEPPETTNPTQPASTLRTSIWR